MYFSTQQLITLWNEQGGTNADLKEAVHITHSLLKTLGSKLNQQLILDQVAKEDETLASFIGLLHRIGKLNTSSLQDLLYELKNVVQEDENVEVQKLNTEEKVGLVATGNGKIYKRMLQRDLDKLLH